MIREIGDKPVPQLGPGGEGACAASAQTPPPVCPGLGGAPHGPLPGSSPGPGAEPEALPRPMEPLSESPPGTQPLKCVCLSVYVELKLLWVLVTAGYLMSCQV